MVEGGGGGRLWKVCMLQLWPVDDEKQSACADEK